MAKINLRAAVTIASVAVALANCAHPTSEPVKASQGTEEQRATAALAAETSHEIDTCIDGSATVITSQPSNAEARAEDIANTALSQCEYLLNEYESDDGALVLASDPTASLASASTHARRSKAEMSKWAARRAVAIVLDRRSRLARQ